MKILHKNDDSVTANSIVYMNDVYANLIGKKVDVHISSAFLLTGMLQAYNGNIIQLFNYVTKMYTYIPVEKIIAISSEE